MVGGGVGAVVLGLGALIGMDKRRPRWTFQGSSGIVGQAGVAHNTLSPGGTIVVNAELWSARSAGDIEIDQGAPVRVVGMEGLTAIVESDPDPPPSPSESRWRRRS